MESQKLLFSTHSYEYLAERMLAYNTLEKGQVERKIFPDGERYQRIVNDVNDRDVVIVGGTISDNDTLALYDLACACVSYGARSLTLVIPYFGYSTMERAVKYGEVVTAKNRATLISSIPRNGMGNRVILVDLHTEGLPHYFESGIRPVHLYCKDIVREAALEIGGKDFVLASTDAGRAKWVESLANDMHVNAAFVLKRRISGEKTQVTSISADVEGKRVIIYDDMIRTGGSLVNAAKAYKEAGASDIFVITTHGLFNNNALQRIKDSGIIHKVVSTDTHPNAEQMKNDFLMVKSVAKLLVDKLDKTH
jgi:ribose-phosphate pyrophosphokinase